MAWTATRTGAAGTGLGGRHLDNVREISAPRASGLLWRLVIGIIALILMAGGGAWLMHAGIDQSLEAQAASDITTSSTNDK